MTPLTKSKELCSQNHKPLQKKKKVISTVLSITYHLALAKTGYILVQEAEMCLCSHGMV